MARMIGQAGCGVNRGRRSRPWVPGFSPSPCPLPSRERGACVGAALTPGPSPTRGEGGRFRHGWTVRAQDDPSTGSGRAGAAGGGWHGIATSPTLLAMTVRAQDERGRRAGAALTPGPSPKRGEGSGFRHGWTGGAQDDPSTGSGRTGAAGGYGPHPRPLSQEGRGERLQHGWTGGAPHDPSTGSG